MNTRKIYSFRFEWSERIAHLSPIVRLEIHEAACHYAQHGSLPEMSSEATAAFEEFIMPDFRRREKAAAYRARRKAQSGAKTESAEPVSNHEKAEKAEEAPSTSVTQATLVESSEVRTVQTEETEIPPRPALNRRQRRRIEREERRARRKGRPGARL